TGYRMLVGNVFFFSSRRRHTRFSRDWSSDVCSSDLFCRIGMPILQKVTDGGWYVPNGLMLLPPSAFFLIGLIIWGIRAVKKEQEIGRASCRERGQISLVAGRFQDNHYQQHDQNRHAG